MSTFIVKFFCTLLNTLDFFQNNKTTLQIDVAKYSTARIIIVLEIRFRETEMREYANTRIHEYADTRIRELETHFSTDTMLSET